MAGWSASRFAPAGLVPAVPADLEYPKLPHPEWERIGVRG
jgi:hypothetical protein